MPRGNTFYKVASVLVAAVLTVYVYGERNPLRSTLLSVRLMPQLQSSSVLIESVPKSVQVEVRGPKGSLEMVGPDDLQAIINLAGKGPGIHRLRVGIEPAPGATLPPEVTLLPVEPLVTVGLTAIIKRTRPLQAVFIRPAPAGFAYGVPAVDPPAAAVSGPREAVSRVAQIQVIVDGAAIPRKPLEGRFPVRVVDKSGAEVPEVKAKPDMASVKVSLERTAGQKEILVSPNITGAVAPGYKISSITVDPQSVIVTGAPDTLGELNFVTTQEISVAGLTADESRTVQMLLPDSVSTGGSRQVNVAIKVTPAF